MYEGIIQGDGRYKYNIKTEAIFKSFVYRELLEREFANVSVNSKLLFVGYESNLRLHFFFFGSDRVRKQSQRRI